MIGVLVLELVSSLAAAPPAQSWASLGARFNGWSSLSSGTPGRGFTGALDITLFPTRALDDDEAPYSLQPYLQRLTAIGLHAQTGGSDTSIGSSFENTTTSSLLSADAGGYVGSHGVLGASLGFESISTVSTRPFLGPQLPLVHGYYSIIPAVTAGLRFGDLQVDFSYRLAPVYRDGSWQTVQWGRLTASLQYVWARCLYLSLTANVYSSSAGSGNAFLEFYPSKHFGIYGSLGGTASDANGATYASVGGQLGVSYWVSRRLGVSAAVLPEWQGTPGMSTGGFVHCGFFLGLYSHVP